MKHKGKDTPLPLPVVVKRSVKIDVVEGGSGDRDCNVLTLLGFLKFHDTIQYEYCIDTLGRNVKRLPLSFTCMVGRLAD